MGMTTSGTREQLLVRFKRWVLHRAIVADVAVQCAAVAVDRSLNGSGGVYTIDVPTPSRRTPPLVQLRQFQGKGYAQLGTSFASDAVYAIEAAQRHVFLLRGVDHFTDTGPPTQASAHGKGGALPGSGAARAEEGGADPFGLGGGWLLAGRWLSVLKKERTLNVSPGGHFACCSTEGGEAYTWGLGPHGELGSNHPCNMDDPQEPLTMHLLPPNEEVRRVASGAFHGVAAMASGRCFAWGCNASNELGLSNTFTGDLRDCFYAAPVAVDALGLSPTPGLIGHRRHVVLVACGASHSVAVDRDGRVVTWGCRDGGRLGRRDTGWPVEEGNGDDVGTAAAARRRKVRPQGGGPPGEVEGLWDEEEVACVGVACGAWHTLLLCVPRGEVWDPDPEGTKARLKREAWEKQRRLLLGGGSDDDDDGNEGGGGSPAKHHHKKGKKKKKKKKREKEVEVNFGLGSDKRPGIVFSFGSGINGQLGLNDVHMSPQPARVLGLPAEGVVSVKAGTYVSACADAMGRVWYWGSRGAGMFQPIPTICELPKGQRAGGLEDVACTRDALVFLTKGVGPEYFESMVDDRIAQFKAQREADNAEFSAKLLEMAAEAEAHILAKGEAFMRGAMARFRFARRAVKMYVNRKVVDPDTGRKRRVYVNLKTGVVLKKRPYFLKAFGMEPEREEEQRAAGMLQRCARRYLARKEARARAAALYEECVNADFPEKVYWFNPRTEASFWTRPRWLE